MAYYFIHTTNALFKAEDEGAEYVDRDAGRRAMIDASGQVALDEINRGSKSVVVEAELKERSGQTIDRLAISVSVADLMIGGQDARNADTGAIRAAL